jgi:hypothetical protein
VLAGDGQDRGVVVAAVTRARQDVEGRRERAGGIGESQADPAAAEVDPENPRGDG